MKNKRVIVIFGVILVLIGLLFFTLGVFVIQPIGQLPQGITLVYFRLGLNLPFASSPDGISLKAIGSVSLFSRMSALNSFFPVIEKRIIARLPYIDMFYSISTNGQRFEQ